MHNKFSDQEHPRLKGAFFFLTLVSLCVVLCEKVLGFFCPKHLKQRQLFSYSPWGQEQKCLFISPPSANATTA